MQAIQLTLVNFGGCCGSDTYTLKRDGQTISMKNGHGKTTIVNAYIWALSGRTLQGFEPKHLCKRADNNDPTEVIIVGLLPKPLKRILKEKGGTLAMYGGMPVTNKQVEAIIEEHLAPLDFVLACADPNALTDSALTPAQLRSLLYVCGALNESLGPQLRAERAELAKKVKDYEKYALANVEVPARTNEPLTRIEEDLLRDAESNEWKAQREVVETCQVCGAKLEDGLIEQVKVEKAKAQAWLDDYAEEIERVRTKKKLWADEEQELQHLTWLAENAKNARKQVITLQAQIEELDEKIREADARDVSSQLPEGMEIITEKVRKAGAAATTCSLTLNGVPLKSINRSARVKLLVELLLNARVQKDCEHVPILVDNAESIDKLPKILNVTWFIVKRE